MYETLVNRVSALAAQHPDKLAVAFKKETLTYAELKDRMVRIGRRLAALGVKNGDRVLLSATSKPEMVAAYLGVQYAGGVVVFVDKNATQDNALFIYQDTDAVLFLTDKPMKQHDGLCRVHSLRAIFQEGAEGELSYVLPKGDALAELLYTSGTTGTPKGVMLTYNAVYHIWMNTIEGIGIRESDRILLPLPLNHSFALRVLRAYLYRGASVVLQNGFTFAKEIENNLLAYQCTAIAIVPASVETVDRQMQDRFAEIMGRFRYIEVGAGSLTVEQRKRLTAQLPHTTLYNTWGSSESGGALFCNVTEVAADPVKIAAVGKPLPCVEVRALDAQGEPQASDREHPGRMAIKGEMEMSGYWNRPELTAETLQDGWLITSDMVYLDEAGYVYMLGRADDIINVGGEKVSPVEVENIAGEYEHIKECACIGVPDPDNVLGSVPVLFVVPKDNAYAPEDMARYLAQRMERYKLPARYIPLLALPRNRMKKLDRKALRLLWEQQGGDSLMNETVRTILTRRSIRKFADKPIPKEILEMLVMCGYYAPSGHNMQTWKFTVITKPEEIQRLKEAARQTAKENKVYFYGFENPAALILVSNDARNANGCQDASCASENIMLAAWSYGIGSTWLNPLMPLRGKEPVKSVLDSYKIPEKHTIWSMISLGYPVGEGVLLQKKSEVVQWIE